MMNIFKTFTINIPLYCLIFLGFFKDKKTKGNVLAYYKNNPTTDTDINNALNYIRNHPFYSITSRIKTFPYPFSDKYIHKEIKMLKDDSNGLFYVMRNGKKLYFRRNITNKKAKILYNSLLIEQDKDSAHLYLTDEFDIADGDILVDVGCAEAFLALDVIEKIKKVYLFEYEDEWIEALNYTFAPWKEKVEIVKKYATDHTGENDVSLDDFFINREMPGFIKIDVEGAELQVLNGMKNMIEAKHPMKLVICTYHRRDDYKNITEHVLNAGLRFTTSNSHMLFKIIPFFRKGLIRVVT
ncbi:MAG: FkbM family methyltransferase [Tannerella sp.]|jgi:hypothetical protein|nr:FkbM family methyltransferase [Tannerella sp.]